MTLTELISELKKARHKDILILEGEFRFKVTEQDAMSARLLDWLYGEVGLDTTVGEVFDILNDAIFWLTFWQALDKPDPKENDND